MEMSNILCLTGPVTSSVDKEVMKICFPSTSFKRLLNFENRTSNFGVRRGL